MNVKEAICAACVVIVAYQAFWWLKAIAVNLWILIRHGHQGIYRSTMQDCATEILRNVKACRELESDNQTILRHMQEKGVVLPNLKVEIPLGLLEQSAEQFAAAVKWTA